MRLCYRLILTVVLGCSSGGATNTVADSRTGPRADTAADQLDPVAPDALSVADATDAESPTDTVPSTETGSLADTVASPSTSPTTATTSLGSVDGVIDGAGTVFRGIPYAAPPVGAGRFAPPADYSDADSPAAPLDGLRADTFGASCLQLDADTGDVIGAEDCLTLNIWTPTPLDQPSPARAVMVFVHGGGHVQGSGAQTLAGGALVYDGRRLADATGAVVVTFNYRLGPFGYLALPEMADGTAPAGSTGQVGGAGQVGNFGLADQIAALRWVHDHIAAFGGDPSHVLLFGESAGAVSACALVASPAAQGLFQAAIMQSGACTAAPFEKAVIAGDERVGANTTCAAGTGRMACLRAMDAATLLRAIPGHVNIGSPTIGAGAGDYGPIVAPPLLPSAPLERIAAGEHNRVPMIVGSNADELAEAVVTPVPTAAVLEAQLRLSMVGLVPADHQDAVIAMYSADKYPTPKDAFVAFLSDVRFSCSARAALTALGKGQNEPVYRYYFSRRAALPSGKTKLAVHGIELMYVFGSLDNIAFYTPAAADSALSTSMMSLWGSFAATGTPSDLDAPAWPAWTEASDPAMVLDAPLFVQDGVRAAECEALEAAVAP